jgi:CRP/FNR family transcriptional regulator
LATVTPFRPNTTNYRDMIANYPAFHLPHSLLTQIYRLVPWAFHQTRAASDCHASGCRVPNVKQWRTHPGEAFMNAVMEFPIVLRPSGAVRPCATCGVRRISVCDAIPEAHLARLGAVAIGGVARPGTLFIEEADDATAFFNIVSGTARLYKLLPDGRRQITGFANGGSFLGLAVSDFYAFSAEAIDTVRYCRFPRIALRALMRDFPRMEERLLKVASTELVAAQEQMLLLGRKSARERVASFLMARARLASARATGDQRAPVSFVLPMTRGDIADYLGMTIETVVRTLKKLRDERLIEVNNTQDVVITDANGLRALAEGSHRA